LLAPPYLWTATNVGVIQIAALVGFTVACFGGGWVADLITTKLIVRADYNYFQEQRLISLIPGFWIGPIGCIIVAFSCAQKLSWVAIAFGFGMGTLPLLHVSTLKEELVTCHPVSFATVFAPNIALTYVVESYPDHGSDCLVAVNVFKNIVAFVLAFEAVDWVKSGGWIEVYMVIFTLVSLSMLLAVPLYFFGGALRQHSYMRVPKLPSV
jgi:hypothetical protein